MFRILKLFAIFILFPLSIYAENYELSICTIFKNDAPFLKEWIEFHKLQGVTHFYLYNNNSTDNYETVLKPYIEKNEVTLTQWNFTYKSGDTDGWHQIQRNSYKDCLDKYGSQSEWIAFLDSDEFLFSVKGEPLPKFLKNYKKYGAVCAYWLLFGTSDVEDIPSGSLMIEYLTRCCQKTIPRNNRVKSIVQPKYVKSVKSAHHFYYKPGYFHVDEHFRRFEMHGPITYDKIRINHYWTRTEKYFREHKMPSRNNRRHHEVKKVLRGMADSYNTRTDKVIQQYVPALRKSMGFKQK